MELITTRKTLAEVMPGVGVPEALRGRFGKADEVPFIRKGLVPADVEFPEGERGAVSYITTLAVDRDEEVVLPSGGDLTDYRRNPVVLWAHKYDTLPLGMNVWIKPDGPGLVAKTIYDEHEEAQKVYGYRKRGNPLAESIGFIPLEAVTPRDQDAAGWEKALTAWRGEFKAAYGKAPTAVPKRIYTKWALLEYSDVPVPANQEAVSIAVAKGVLPGLDHLPDDEAARYVVRLVHRTVQPWEEPALRYHDAAGELLLDVRKDGDGGFGGPEVRAEIERAVREIVEKPGWDETESSFRRRVRDPADFQDGTMRTVTLQEKKPQVSSVQGKLKGQDTMTIQSIIFPKSEGWTLAAAKTWVADHPDALKVVEPEAEPEPDAKAEYECECLDCGHTLTSAEHCDQIKCPECGGKMRRVERPGPGKAAVKEGRVLSGKNRATVEKAVAAMAEAAAALKELLAASEPKPAGDAAPEKAEPPMIRITREAPLPLTPGTEPSGPLIRVNAAELSETIARAVVAASRASEERLMTQMIENFKRLSGTPF